MNFLIEPAHKILPADFTYPDKLLNPPKNFIVFGQPQALSLVATKVRAVPTLKSGPRTETTLKLGISEMFIGLLFSEKIVTP